MRVYVRSTTVYYHVINFDADSYYSETAKTINEARKLVEAGFEFVCDMDGYKLYRKPK